MGNDICIIGGLGHVGLPLGIVLADKGFSVVLTDVDPVKAEIVRSGRLPFIEYGAEPILKKVLASGKLTISLDDSVIESSRTVIVAIGTPVDEYLNPKTRQFLEFIKKLKKHIRPEQLIIIRSSIYPNTCMQVKRLFGKGDWKIAYCPERIVQGFAVKELGELPQIVSGLSEEAADEASAIFSAVSPRIIRCSVSEAELAKLFSNALRYIQFATANQFYMICDNLGVDYNKVRSTMSEGYGRAANLPTAGFAAGPCLLKDTMQLSSLQGGNFMLGHSAMLVNEGLPHFVVEKIRKKHDIEKVKVGILGMAFKADVDDIRDSLSYKLGKILRFYGADVSYSDEFAKDPTFISKEEMLLKCDVIVIGVPHTAYKDLEFPKNTEVIDLWDIVKE